MIIIQGPSLPDMFKTLQNTPHITDEWCNEHRLEISKYKSALIPMFIRNREEYKGHPTIVVWGINVVSKMRYLGIKLDCKLDCYLHTQYLEHELLRVRNSLIRCSKATRGMTFHSLMTVYKIHHTPSHHIRLRVLEYLDFQKSRSQTAANP